MRPRPIAKPSNIVLWGDELTELGRRRIEAPKPDVAIGLSAGAKRKAYSYTDPNEDAVAVAITATRTLLVMADGHNGMASTRAAIGHVLDELGNVPAPSGVPDHVLVDVFHQAGEAVQAAANAARQPESRTTLIVAIFEIDELRWAVMGDSLLSVVSPNGEVAFLGERLSRYVGYPMTPSQVDERLGRGFTRLREGSWVIAATDGLSDFVPQLKHRLAAVTAASRRAPAVVEQLIDDAFDGGAGDNIAVAAVAISTSVASRASTAPARPIGAELDSRDSRTRGCLIGGAAGDALGAPIEFLSIHQIRQRYGPAEVTEYEPAYGHRGAITDDTQMTLFTAEGLLRSWIRGASKGIQPDVLAVVDHAYGRWLKTQGETGVRFDDSIYDGWLIGEAGLHHRRAPGNTCLAALHAPHPGSIRAPLNDSKGCGGVMRIAPVGLAARALGHDPFELGCEIAALTHGHPSGYLAAGALAEIIAALVIDDQPLEAALDRAAAKLSDHRRHEETSQALAAARDLAGSHKAPSPETVATLGQGWVAEEALAIATYCALVATDFVDGVRLAVNHSGDSDSTGAITGNILGAITGYGGIPARWVHGSGLDLHKPIERLCRDWNAIFVFEPPPDVEQDSTWEQRYPPW